MLIFHLLNSLSQLLNFQFSHSFIANTYQQITLNLDTISITTAFRSFRRQELSPQFLATPPPKKKKLQPLLKLKCNKTTNLLPLVAYEVVITNSTLRASFVIFITFSTRARGVRSFFFLLLRKPSRILSLELRLYILRQKILKFYPRAYLALKLQCTRQQYRGQRFGENYV